MSTKFFGKNLVKIFKKYFNTINIKICVPKKVVKIIYYYDIYQYMVSIPESDVTIWVLICYENPIRFKI